MKFHLILISIVLFHGSILAQDNLSSLESTKKKSSETKVGKTQKKYAVKKENVKLISGNASVDLTEEQLQSLIKKANNGDGIAAGLLADYYDLVQNDPVNTIFWLRKGAESGEPTAQYNLAVMLLKRKNNQINREEAVHWLELAGQKGIVAAKSVLERLKREDMKNAIPAERTSTH